jgi:hypothetical protein
MKLTIELDREVDGRWIVVATIGGILSTSEPLNRT